MSHGSAGFITSHQARRAATSDKAEALARGETYVLLCSAMPYIMRGRTYQARS